jgi:hypothetical protein
MILSLGYFNNILGRHEKNLPYHDNNGEAEKKVSK